jgi:hypothetical protein
MEAAADTIMDEEVPRARLALLLQHFSKLDDGREPWRVMYPLKEVLLLVVCATPLRWFGAPSSTSRMSCLANLRDSASRNAWKHAVLDVGMIR